MKAHFASGLALLGLVLSHAAWAQGFPSKPVHMIVPFSPGGGVDVQARLVSQKLTESPWVMAVIDYKPGASGILGRTSSPGAA
jgi:tripartite-type tricarboxylate transporter receptor subunit TctC